MSRRPNYTPASLSALESYIQGVPPRRSSPTESEFDDPELSLAYFQAMDDYEAELEEHREYAEEELAALHGKPVLA